MLFPPLWLIVKMMFFGSSSEFFHLLNTVGWVNAICSALVSSDHSTFSQAFLESGRYLLANVRNACTHVPSWVRWPCKYFKISVHYGANHKQAPTVQFEAAPDHSHSTRQDLAWSSRLRATKGHFLCVPLLYHGTNSCYPLTKPFADGFYKPFHPCAGLQFFPWHLLTALAQAGTEIRM